PDGRLPTLASDQVYGRHSLTLRPVLPGARVPATTLPIGAARNTCTGSARTAGDRMCLRARPPKARWSVWRQCASSSSAAGGDDRLHQARDHVVDMPGDGDARGDRGCGVEALDVAGDGPRRVEDGVLAQGRLLYTDSIRVAAAEGVVDKRSGAALGVVDHGDLEQRAVRQHVLGELADEGDIVDDLRGDPPADVADDRRVAEAQAEEVCGVDARIEARDHEQAQLGEDDRALVAAGGGEDAVALERGIDVGRVGLAAAGQLKPGRPAHRAGSGHEWCELLVAHDVLSPFARASGQLRAAAVAGEPSAPTSGVSSPLVFGWAGSSTSAITAPAAATPAAR